MIQSSESHSRAWQIDCRREPARPEQLDILSLSAVTSAEVHRNFMDAIDIDNDHRMRILCWTQAQVTDGMSQLDDEPKVLKCYLPVKGAHPFLCNDKNQDEYRRQTGH